jgi:hypothetical protein
MLKTMRAAALAATIGSREGPPRDRRPLSPMAIHTLGHTQRKRVSIRFRAIVEIGGLGSISTMKNSCVVAASFLACLAGTPCLARAPTAAEVASRSFQQLCATGPLSPGAIFAKADAAGWRRSGPEAAANFDPATQRLSPVGEPLLLLTASTETSLGERRDACSIAVAVRTTGLAEAVQNWLGFAPSFSMASSATYFALRSGEVWNSGAALSRDEFLKAKADGRFYSVVIGDRGEEEPNLPYPAVVMLLHVQPSSGAN